LKVSGLAEDSPLRIAVFASGSGGNLGAALRLAAARPRLVQVAAVVSDRPECAAVGIARRAAIPLLAADFLAECGRASECRDEKGRVAYRRRAEAFHDRLGERLAGLERDEGPIDLVVLSYAHWIHGRLLTRFVGRMINQHPGDLTLLDAEGRRLLVGNDPVRLALRNGSPTVRAATFFVDAGQDTGPIICQGPAIPAGRIARRDAAGRLEARLKRASEQPSLICALVLIAAGAVSIERRRHVDGSRRVSIRGVSTGFGGLSLMEGLADRNPVTRDIFGTVREAIADAQG
jgi:folate-dependent phosphoribosylglycinamide formyltransferase PurN